MVRAGEGNAAVSSMHAAIRSLVDNSLSERSYPKALDAVKALRQDAVARKLGAGFNNFLRQLADKCAITATAISCRGLERLLAKHDAHPGQLPLATLRTDRY